MKKFSCLENNKQILTQTEKLDKILEQLFEENISLEVSGEPTLETNYKLEGKEKLIKELQEYIINQKHKVRESITTQNSYTPVKDVMHINNRISLLEESLKEYEILPHPEDLFNSKDFEIDKDGIVLNNISYVPESYADYIKPISIESYFSNGHKLKLEYHKDKWTINFRPELAKYDGSDDQKWRSFVIENKDFISDFLTSSSNLLGSASRIDTNSLLLNF